MKLAVLLAVIAFALTAAAPSQAVTVKASSAQTRASYERVAAEHWGVSTPVVWHYCRYGPDGRSYPASPCQLLPGSAGIAEIGGNDMWLRSEWWRWNSYERRCQVFVHEYGHLLGHFHDPNPRAVMHPSVTRLNLPAVCRGFRP